jgi:hypothetical protein
MSAVKSKLKLRRKRVREQQLALATNREVFLSPLLRAYHEEQFFGPRMAPESELVIEIPEDEVVPTEANGTTAVQEPPVANTESISASSQETPS